MKRIKIVTPPYPPEKFNNIAPSPNCRAPKGSQNSSSKHHFSGATHPKFNSSPLKNGGTGRRLFPFGFRPIFRGELLNFGRVYLTSGVVRGVMIWLGRLSPFLLKWSPLYLEDHPSGCKWLITMVSFRPLSRVVGPLANGHSWLINGGF